MDYPSKGLKKMENYDEDFDYEFTEDYVFDYTVNASRLRAAVS